MSLHYYITSVHIMKEPQLVSYRHVEDMELEIYSLFSQHFYYAGHTSKEKNL